MLKSKPYRRVTPVVHAVHVPDLNPATVQALEDWIDNAHEFARVTRDLRPGYYVVQTIRGDLIAMAPDLFEGSYLEVVDTTPKGAPV